MPNASHSFHRIPRLKSQIFQTSPNQWMIPTSSSVSGSGKNITSAGTMIVDVPKPVSVPTPPATTVNTAISATVTLATAPASVDR